MKRFTNYLLYIHNNKKGEIATTLAIISIAILLAGLVVGRQVADTTTDLFSRGQTPNPTPTGTWCSETDNGMDPTQLGETCSNTFTTCMTDTCVGTQITEYYCQNNASLSVTQPCPAGTTCSNGVCVDPNTPPPTATPLPTATPIPAPGFQCLSVGARIQDYPHVAPGNIYDFFASSTGGTTPLTGTWSMLTVGGNPVTVGTFTPYTSTPAPPDIVPRTWTAPASFPAGTTGVSMLVTLTDANGSQSTCAKEYPLQGVPVPSGNPPSVTPTTTPGVCGVVPTDIVIAIDRSGSMTSQDTVGSITQILLEWEKEAAQILIDAFSFLPGSADDIRFAVVDWGGNTANISTSGPLTNDFNSVKNYLTGIQSPPGDSYTCIQCGIRQSAQIFEEPPGSENTNNKVVIIMSDGIANRQWGSNANVEPPGAPPCVNVQPYGWHCPKADELAIEEATIWKLKNINFHVIGYGDNASNPPTILENNLTNIASNPTATYYHYGRDTADWDSIFVDIGTEICPEIITVVDALKQVYPSLDINSSTYTPPNSVVPLCSYPDAANITCLSDPLNTDLYMDLALFLNALRGDVTIVYDPLRPDLDKNGDQIIDSTDIIALLGLATGELNVRLDAALNTKYR